MGSEIDVLAVTCLQVLSLTMGIYLMFGFTRHVYETIIKALAKEDRLMEVQTTILTEVKEKSKRVYIEHDDDDEPEKPKREYIEHDDGWLEVIDFVEDEKPKRDHAYDG